MLNILGCSIDAVRLAKSGERPNAEGKAGVGDSVACDYDF